MTPEIEKTGNTYNDAPSELLRKQLKCAIMELDKKDRIELLRPYVEKYYGA